MLDSSHAISQEKLIFQDFSKEKHELNDDDPEIQDILLDFQKLDFEKVCNDACDVINYNEGKEADPFNKIAKYYGRKKNVFLFISMLRSKEQLEKIINIINDKCDVQTKDKFIKKIDIYLDRINKGERDAKEFLSDDNDMVAFFNGYHVACPGHDCNIHENLNINITKPKEALDISSFFDRKTGRIEEEKSELKRVKIYSNGKRIVTVVKNDKQQRNYTFTKFATCKIEINWNIKDKSGKDIDCILVLSISSGKVGVETLINCEKDKLKEMSCKNEVVLINDKCLHEVLEDCQI